MKKQHINYAASSLSRLLSNFKSKNIFTKKQIIENKNAVVIEQLIPFIKYSVIPIKTILTEISAKKNMQ